MDELGEWCFEFRVSAVLPIRREVIDGLMDELIRWAEARRLGIGGYRAATAEVAGAAGAWAFYFGLCVPEDGQVIPRPEAGGLWAAVEAWCARDGFTCRGGFRPFPPDVEDETAC